MEIGALRPLAELASGVDSFYLTGRCILPGELVEDLERTRGHAGEVRVAIPMQLGGETFHVGWGPFNRYRFRLEHRWAMVGMTVSEGIPSLYVQPTAEFIHASGIDAVYAWCQSVFESVVGHVQWQVSRIDLFMDVQGWNVSADDRFNFLSRASMQRTYEEDHELTGLQWGVGGDIVCRIYDKTRESADKGTDWWPSVWGSAFRPDDRVIRIEFQVRRSALRQYGLNSPDEVLTCLRPLWDRLTGKWLTLRVPNDDSNRSRWALDPTWLAVQAATLGGAPIGDELVRQGASSGDLRRLIPALVGYATSAGAHLNATTHTDLMDVLSRLLTRDALQRGVSVEHRLAAQRLRLRLA